MLDELERIVRDIGNVNTKLVLLLGPPRSGKSALLADLSRRSGAPRLNLGASLGRALLAEPGPRRRLRTGGLLNGLVQEQTVDNLLLVDNIELLFDQSLQLSPLDLLKRLAHACRVVATWPGELRDGQLSYATIGHPEHCSYPAAGLTVFPVHTR